MSKKKIKKQNIGFAMCRAILILIKSYKLRISDVVPMMTTIMTVIISNLAETEGARMALVDVFVDSVKGCLEDEDSSFLREINLNLK